MNYPYLGEKQVGGKSIVIMFTSEGVGVVVANETNMKEDYPFGKNGNFDESEFEYFPIDGDPRACVRLTN